MPAKESVSGPIILHLDSLGMHHSTKILNTVGRQVTNLSYSHLAVFTLAIQKQEILECGNLACSCILVQVADHLASVLQIP
jgi:hypothetical protein